MLNDPDKEAAPEPIQIRCYFVRERNALLVRGEFSPLYTDYYLHLMQHQIRYEESQDLLLKDGLAALTLHLASRPWSEAIAWTLNWQDPLQNVFVTGSNQIANVTGRVFTEDIRERDKDLFYAQVNVQGEEPRQSMIEVDELDMFRIAERYYEQSEQRLGRYFCHHDEDFVLITAQPGCDMDWLAGLDNAAVAELDKTETLALLETREYRFECGCSPKKIFPIIAAMSGDTVDSIFDGAEVIPAGCPRCGARYIVTREALEAWISEQK